MLEFHDVKVKIQDETKFSILIELGHGGSNLTRHYLLP